MFAHTLTYENKPTVKKLIAQKTPAELEKYRSRDHTSIRIMKTTHFSNTDNAVFYTMDRIVAYDTSRKSIGKLPNT